MTNIKNPAPAFYRQFFCEPNALLIKFLGIFVLEKKIVKDEWGQNSKIAQLFHILFFYGKTIIPADFGVNTKVVENDETFQIKFVEKFYPK